MPGKKKVRGVTSRDVPGTGAARRDADKIEARKRANRSAGQAARRALEAAIGARREAQTTDSNN